MRGLGSAWAGLRVGISAVPLLLVRRSARSRNPPLFWCKLCEPVTLRALLNVTQCLRRREQKERFGPVPELVLGEAKRADENSGGVFHEPKMTKCRRRISLRTMRPRKLKPPFVFYRASAAFWARAMVFIIASPCRLSTSSSCGSCSSARSRTSREALSSGR